MHRQLTEIIDDFNLAQERLHALVKRVPDDRWVVRTNPAKWSVSENVEHLNLTSEIYLPVLTAAIEETRKADGTAPDRYRRDFMGWALWRIMPPPVRVFRVKTAPGFVPTAALPPERIRERFDQLQQQLLALTAAADGLPIDRTFITSPVDGRARYNLFSALGILPRHQHRHLWQAEKSL
jgi:hypothetical protein